MNLRRRLEVRLVGGLFRVIAFTARVVIINDRCEPNPEPIREYVHQRTFAENGEAWKLALRVQNTLRCGGSIDLRHWDVVSPGDLPADRLLPAAVDS